MIANLNFNKNIQEIIEDVYNNELYLNDTEILGAFLYGSQNYGLDIDNSDIDLKVIVMPSLGQLIFRKDLTSKVEIFKNNINITCEIKDIRDMFNCYKAQGINFIETLFTPYKVINKKYEDLFNDLFELNEFIAKLNFGKTLNAALGMMSSKIKKFNELTCYRFNEDEQIIKQYVHILRLQDFINRYIKNVKYSEILIPENVEKLKELRYKSIKDLSLLTIKDEIDKIYNESKELVNNYNEKNYFEFGTLVSLDNLLIKFFDRKLSSN